MDIKKILVAGEFTHCKNKETDAKYFIVFKTDKKKITQLFITLPQMSKCLKRIRKTNQCMSFELLKKSVWKSVKTSVWNKGSNAKKLK